MIHLTDIQQRLSANQEPKEITEMRENVISAFSNLEFIEEGHIYNIHNPDGSVIEKIPSASAIIHRFEPEADWDDIANNYALKRDLNVDDVKRKWKENNLRATNSGSVHHLYGEMLQNFIRTGDKNVICEAMKLQYEQGYLIPSSGKQDAIMKYWEELFVIDDIYPFMAECKMYMPLGNKYGINEIFCGTADILLAYKKNNKYQILLHDYKGLPLDTPIATIDGWKNMGDINIGDIVFDKNGKPTKVVNVSSIHHNPCLKIKFDNNTEIVCDEEHRWEVSFFKERHVNKVKERYFESIVMTGKELFDFFHDENNLVISKKTGKKILDSHKVPKILNSKPIEMPNCELPIHPYVFGVWLGDGNKVDGKVTNMYNELWEEIKKCGYEIGNDVSQCGSGKAQTRTIFGLSRQLRLLGVLKNKHIPDIYLRSSYEQRIDLLRGIMDTDGYYNPKRNRYVMATNRWMQVDFMVKLLYSLGIKPTIIKAKGRCSNCKKIEYFDKWDVCFSSDVYPFKIRKINVLKNDDIRKDFRNIKSVEYCDTVDTKCIEVDSPTHTYCCGYDMLVTHNTNKVLISDFNQSNGVTMLPPFDDMIDEPLSHYTIQLSLYSMMLENLGYDVIDRRIIWLKDDGTYEKIKVPYIKDKIIESFKIN